MMRQTIKKILETDPEIEVIGTARDGEEALKKADALLPDVITMDINMPNMDGLTAMSYLFQNYEDVRIIMLSSLTQEGALITFEALELGAMDYVGKPSGTVSANLHVVGRELIAKIKAAVHSKRRRIESRPKISGRAVEHHAKQARVPGVQGDNFKKIVVIGVSTGGPATLMEILPKLPADLDAALIVVQHMPPSFTASFAQRLDNHCDLYFCEAKAGDKLGRGIGYVAPGGSHLLLKKSAVKPEYFIRLTAEPRDALFIPSVDVTMHAVAELFGPRTVGVLLTGMGSDGADGMVAIRKAGGITIAEDESTAIVFGMPREAIARGGAEIVVPAGKVAEEIVKAVAR